MQDSTPNWPVVGGVYAVKIDPNNLRLRVASIEIDGPNQMVTAFFVKNDGSEDSLPLTCYPQSFREVTLSGYQSPVPALVAALKAIQFKGHNQVCPICKGTKKTGHGAMCDVRLALALAGETGGEETT